MHVRHSGVEELLIDGQPLYVASSAVWEALWSEPVFEGKRLAVPDPSGSQSIVQPALEGRRTVWQVNAPEA